MKTSKHFPLNPVGRRLREALEAEQQVLALLAPAWALPLWLVAASAGQLLLLLLLLHNA